MAWDMGHTLLKRNVVVCWFYFASWTVFDNHWKRDPSHCNYSNEEEVLDGQRDPGFSIQ